jgi:parallel beta-helix repeat protein
MKTKTSNKCRAHSRRGLILLGLTCFLLTGARARAALPAGEYWVSPVSVLGGTGTEVSPFDGSTQTLFDAKMANFGPSTIIHLLPGTFYTAGSYANGPSGPQLHSNTHLIGSGIDATTVQIGTVSQNTSWVIASIQSGASNVVVSDMTVDCNISNATGNYSVASVNLFGSNNAIRRVQSINAVGPSATECFALACNNALNQSNTGPSPGNFIESCVVTNTQGSNMSAISFNSISATATVSGTARNNRVYMGAVTTFQVAYNVNQACNTLFENNYAASCNVGFYSDTGNDTNIIYAHNIVEGCRAGLNYSVSSSGLRDTIAFINNTVILTNLGSSYPSYGVILYSGNTHTNIAILGNTFRNSNLSANAGGYGIYLQGATNVTIADNAIDSNLAGGAYLFNTLSTCANVNVYNNRDCGGKPLSRRTASIGNGVQTQLTYADSYLGVRGIAGSAYAVVYLPDAIRCPGKEFTIKDEAGNAGTINIIIYPVPTSEFIDNIPGTTGYIISQNWGRVKLISDGANWFTTD